MVVCQYPLGEGTVYMIAVNGRWVYCSYDITDAHVPANEGDSVLLASTNADNVYKKMRWRGEYIVKF